MQCPKCNREYDSEMTKFCPECGAPSQVFCSKCGKEHSQKFCPECGTAAPAYEQAAEPAAQAAPPQAPVQQPIIINNTNTNTNTNAGYNYVPKSKMTALLLCIFLGGLGGHMFYTGKVGMGILYICTAGLCGIGWVVDVIRIAIGSFRDKWGHPLV